MMIGASLSLFTPLGAGLGAVVRANPADAASPGEPVVSAGLSQSAAIHRAEEPSRPEDGRQSGDDERRGCAAVTAYKIAGSGPEVAAQDARGFQATA